MAVICPLINFRERGKIIWTLLISRWPSMFLIRQIVLLSTFFYIEQVSAGIFSNKCIGKELTIAPNPKTYTDSDGKTQDTDEWKAWKNSRSDWESAQNYSCCEKLVLNGRTCTDPSLQDSDLKSCTNDGGCPTGQGCYKLRDDDLFNADPDDSQAEQVAAEREKKFEEQQNSLGSVDPKPLDSACYRDMECESYKCKSFLVVGFNFLKIFIIYNRLCLRFI